MPGALISGSSDEKVSTYYLLRYLGTFLTLPYQTQISKNVKVPFIDLHVFVMSSLMENLCCLT